MATVRFSRVSRAPYTCPYATSTDGLENFVGTEMGVSS
jgi:hypothetical protein